MLRSCCIVQPLFHAGDQANLGVFTRGVDLPIKWAGRKGRSSRQACAKGRAAAKSAEAVLPLQVVACALCLLHYAFTGIACLSKHVISFVSCACHYVSLHLVLTQCLHTIDVVLLNNAKLYCCERMSSATFKILLYILQFTDICLPSANASLCGYW